MAVEALELKKVTRGENQENKSRGDRIYDDPFGGTRYRPPVISLLR